MAAKMRRVMVSMGVGSVMRMNLMVVIGAVERLSVSLTLCRFGLPLLGSRLP